MTLKRGSDILKNFHNFGTITFSINSFSLVCVWVFPLNFLKPATLTGAKSCSGKFLRGSGYAFFNIRSLHFSMIRSLLNLFLKRVKWNYWEVFYWNVLFTCQTEMIEWTQLMSSAVYWLRFLRGWDLQALKLDYIVNPWSLKFLTTLSMQR